MPTVIIGAGIIGLSTANYLSESGSSAAESVHLVEASPELFASASGFAGGFLAADWFAPPLANLGQLSFDLHKQLAERHNGHEVWGYSQSTSTSLAETNVGSNGGNGADWLTEGVSRAAAAESTDPCSGHAPKWLHSKEQLDMLSSGDSTAQMLVHSHPIRFKVDPIAVVHAIFATFCSPPVFLVVSNYTNQHVQ